MKVIKNIKFKELRDKGANALDIKDDEVIQMNSKNGMLCIITQDYLLKLLEIKNDKMFYLNNNLDTNNQVMGFVNNDLDLKLTGAAKLFSRQNNNDPFSEKKILGKNIQSLLNTKQPKQLEERVSDIEETLKKLLNNKEGDNGTK